MALTFETAPTATGWNAQIAATPNHGNVLQSYQLGEVKRMARWTPRYAVADGIAMTIHEKAGPGFGKVWYLPKGPCVADIDQLRSVLAQVEKAGRQEGVQFVRIEPELRETAENVAALTAMGLKQTAPVQPNSSTVQFELPESADGLLSAYPAKTRNMVRRAGREGVEVERAPDAQETYAVMWDLWRDVVADQELTVRGEDYYKRSWQIMVRGGVAQVLIARVEGTPVAQALVTSIGGAVAEYKEGASVRDRPVPGTSQLVQYEGMTWAIERGAKIYDLVGTPHSSRLSDKSDPRYGLGVFKRGFNKEVIDWVGAWDMVLRPRRYAAWNRIGERVVARVQRRGPGDFFW